MISFYYKATLNSGEYMYFSLIIVMVLVYHI